MLLGGTTELCDVGSGLGDRDSVAELFPLLEPYARQVASKRAASQEPIAAYLGRLASMLDRYDGADRFLHAALRSEEHTSELQSQ